MSDQEDKPEIEIAEEQPLASETEADSNKAKSVYTDDSGSGFLKGSTSAQQGISSLVSSSAVYYERLPMLEVVFDRLVRLMTTTMRNFSGENVEISLESISSVRFGDYMNSIPVPAMVNVFLAEEWDNHGIVLVDTDLIYTMIDVLLGGRRGNAPMRFDNRHFTTIEMSLIERLVMVFLSDLSAAFDPICPITFRFDRMETNPKFASITRPTNVAVMVRLGVQLDTRGGCIELLVPYATLEPIRELLLQNFMGEKFGRDSIWESHLIKELLHTDLEVEAILDEIMLELSTVMDWKVGSQLQLNAKPESLVKIVCGDIPLFMGAVGKKAGNVAVKIDHIINNEEA
ncbi:flagellar motor switch protein FliM [Candidatus Odyssella acanthamoebae]|uniref:Flagellar motor switch protein FliM n=1 Tax=Candidatus Odyssella acanthamoebae TaxID=91604 RepID=A0A077AWR4_9PROT|nr:flagellar motor switch protein FliM [Candidatus Paracaedibacter acanthamoebae]AIK96921.1 flagellar motor switch protein FliM [Candidatus Paracaedibacter acanthamoebae]